MEACLFTGVLCYWKGTSEVVFGEEASKLTTLLCFRSRKWLINRTSINVTYLDNEIHRVILIN